MPTIDDLLGIAVREGASDLHLKAGCLPAIRVNGEIRPVRNWPRLTQENTLTVSFAVMNNKQKERFKENAEIDVAYSVPGLGRFRCNIHQQRGTVGLVFRIIATGVKSADELKLPPVITQIAEERRGLVLVTGATGSGKSTTLAAIIDQINITRSCTIITIEDPIEFLHKDKKSFVIQREIDVDAVSFKSALRGALRQDPDVILVGEMRDYETIETALTAAETGHLVLSTLHTLDATETIQRIVSVFPPHQQQGIRLQLASVLRAVVSMRLVRTNEGKARVPAVEILRSTEFIRECIAYPEKTKHIREAIAKGRSQYGMQTFDQSLYDLFRLGFITYEEALMSATNPEDLKLHLKGFITAGTEDQGREIRTAKQ
ncbi:MAG TPA: type IV pilus twitching motility protein PilT [Blastocatellia bacterium]|nr:type IV pilus twitching motility protein PilT [Blastocatellia bacterium]